ncbi:MAG TPA: hypothetical protein VGN54_08045 [Mycobacteriales bacterium]|jgi:hypothetical protein|nr:hypothetical protein [Mycobacteriales bacterium]
MWLWIDLAIALVPVAVLATVGLSLFGRIKRVRGELRAVTAQVPKMRSPGRHS